MTRHDLFIYNQVVAQTRQHPQVGESTWADAANSNGSARTSVVILSVVSNQSRKKQSHEDDTFNQVALIIGPTNKDQKRFSTY